MHYNGFKVINPHSLYLDHSQAYIQSTYHHHNLNNFHYIFNIYYLFKIYIIILEPSFQSIHNSTLLYMKYNLDQYEHTELIFQQEQTFNYSDEQDQNLDECILSKSNHLNYTCYNIHEFISTHYILINLYSQYLDHMESSIYNIDFVNIHNINNQYGGIVHTSNFHFILHPDYFIIFLIHNYLKDRSFLHNLNKHHLHIISIFHLQNYMDQYHRNNRLQDLYCYYIQYIFNHCS